MDVENKPKRNSMTMTNILPYLQGDLSLRGTLNVMQVNEAQSLKISQIVFIRPNYYVKQIFLKENLDPILKHQMKCESLKSCKSTQAKHMRGSFQFQIQMLSRCKRIHQIQCSVSILAFIHASPTMPLAILLRNLGHTFKQKGLDLQGLAPNNLLKSINKALIYHSE